MKTLDLSDKYSLIANWLSQFEIGFRLAETFALDTPKKIIITGPADSLIAVNIAFNLSENQIKIPYKISYDQSLPNDIDKDSLIIALSFEGNESKLLDNIKTAYEKEIPLVIITAGGELKVFAKERNIPLILIPKLNKYFNTHTTTGYVISALIQIFINSKIIDSDNRDKIKQAVTKISQLYLPQLGKKLALPIKKFTPLIYVLDDYWSVGQTTKTKMNHIVQIPCFWNTISKLMHTEIIGFNNTKIKYFALILEDSGDLKSKKQITLISEVLNKQKIKHNIIEMPGNNKFEKIIGSLWLMDWIVYWLAE